MDGLKINLI